jgi:hypothetical protein
MRQNAITLHYMLHSTRSDNPDEECQAAADGLRQVQVVLLHTQMMNTDNAA